MATINGVSGFVQHSVYQTVWSAMGNSDTGTKEELSRYPNKSVTFNGTFGGATVVLEGSDDDVTYFTVNDIKGNAVSTNAAARFDVVDVPKFMRPRTSGGTGTSINVTLISRSFGH